MNAKKERIPYLGQVIVVRKNRYGVQGSNRRDKPWKRTPRTQSGRIIPFNKKCLNCGERYVKYHHRYCEVCHRELHPEQYQQ